VIITLKSNLRWCSDSFEIRCWNGERVHVAFSLDTCDREVIGLAPIQWTPRLCCQRLPAPIGFGLVWAPVVIT
jgi:hypothetical protein